MLTSIEVTRDLYAKPDVVVDTAAGHEVIQFHVHVVPDRLIRLGWPRGVVAAADAGEGIKVSRRLEAFGIGVQIGPQPVVPVRYRLVEEARREHAGRAEGGRQFRAEIAHVPRVPGARLERRGCGGKIRGQPIPPFVVEALLELHLVVDLPRHLRRVPHFALDPLLVLGSIRLARIPDGRAGVGLASMEP